MIKFTADLKGLHLKAEADKQTGDIHRTAIPHLVATCDRDTLAWLFGETTAELAFGSMRGDGTLPYRQVVPTIVHGAHDVTIADAEFRGAPEISKIVPGQHPREVDVHILIPFSRDSWRPAAVTLADIYGSSGLVITMKPVQQDLLGMEDA